MKTPGGDGNYWMIRRAVAQIYVAAIEGEGNPFSPALNALKMLAIVARSMEQGVNRSALGYLENMEESAVNTLKITGVMGEGD